MIETGPWSFDIHEFHVAADAVVTAMARLSRRLFDLFPDDLRKKAIRRWQQNARSASAMRRYRRRKARRK